MDIINRIRLRLFGFFVGIDSKNNKYYLLGEGKNQRRVVLYAKGNDPTSVPVQWYAWLHGITYDMVIQKRNEFSYVWEKERTPNATGTTNAYRAKLMDSKAQKPTNGAYNAWNPE